MSFIGESLALNALLNLKMEKWLCLYIIWTEGLALPDQNNSMMYLPASNSTLKTLDQILCPIFATSKCSVKFICKKNRPLTFSKTSST